MISGNFDLAFPKSVMRKTTSLKIDPETWKMAKKKCIDKDLSISEYIEKLIKKDVKLIMLILLIIALKIGIIIPILISIAQRKKIIVDLDVVTVAKWDFKEDAINFTDRVIKGEFHVFTPYILLENLSNWDHKNPASKIEHFYNLHSKTIISAENILEKLKKLRINRKELTNEFLLVGVKEEDTILVIVASIFDIDHLITFNRKHLKNKEEVINNVLNKYKLKKIKINLPSEI